MTPAAESSADGSSAGRYRFPASHRLKHRRLIRALFDRGASDVHHRSSGTIRVVYRFVAPTDFPDLDTNVQVGFFVGRKVGGAVIRNKVRRRMKEAYRMHHRDLLEAVSGRPYLLSLGLIFRGREVASWETVSADVAKAVGVVLDHVKERGSGSATPSLPQTG
ncbi:MAG: ribonuclease P protein component [Rhodothermia bacterium]|nr:ribonuclease P protein component [Rhodothermia bacterium]